ncbi:putative ABC transport system permease protein [Arthrobacter sp. CAN_A2]|uniref:ABC transporter permease n=1 Tax=Arthrobacter sp. CAN_A2 TaxID=2787718 RepID=UPI001A21CE12
MNLATTTITVLVLTAVTFALVARLGVDQPWLQPWAIARAFAQLALLSVLLTGIIANPVWVALFLTVMVLAATWVVTRRLDTSWRLAPALGGIITIAAAVPVTIVFTTMAVDLTTRYTLAVAGIIIGNTMTVTTLTGRTLLHSIVTDRDEIETWLALGATPRHATLRIARSAATTALIPSTDQTRTTGLVTLPGAFVGAVFAGASPLEAAQFQLLVLASILTSAAIAATLTTTLLGAPTRIPMTLTPR